MNLTKIKKNKMEGRLSSINWTPLHTRFISHRIGDGTCNYYGHFVYDNKNICHFLNLADKLNIKIWGPIKGDNYSTKKVIISKKIFNNFSNLFNLTSEQLLRDPVKLLDIIFKFPEEHKLQTILALIVDDGSCNRWMITVFEDQNKAIFDKVKELWDSLFPNTSTIYIQITKKGTKVYHLNSNREGVIQLQQKIFEAVNKNRLIASLWWKQKDLDLRYSKAVSKRAKQLNYTLKHTEENKKKVLDHLIKNKTINTKKAMDLLNLTYDRARLLIQKLENDDKIILVYASRHSYYILN